MQIEFVFDYRSPYAYLANTQLSNLTHPIDYVPVDTLTVMKAVNNQPSTECPAKAKYARIDIARWGNLYNVPIVPNGRFFRALSTGEVEGSLLSRAACAAQQAGVFDQVHTAFFEALWTDGENLSTADGRRDFLRKLELDIDLWHLADSRQVRAQLIGNNDDAASRGVFGVPSFFVDGELFFGNDRFEFVRAALNASGGV